MPNPQTPNDVRPRYVLGAVVMTQHLVGADTKGFFSLFENHASPKSQTPIHVHANDDEALYLLEGEMTVVLYGETHVLKPGDSIHMPRHIPHQLMNESDKHSRYLLLCSPSGFEGFLEEGGHLLTADEEIAGPSPEDIARMKRAAPRYGITLLPHWPHDPSAL